MSAASEELARRIRALIGQQPGMAEKHMFGGVGFMLDGNMVAGVTANGDLMVRVAPDAGAEALVRGAYVMKMGERPMKGFVGVPAAAVAADTALSDWLAWSEQYVRTLPPK
jgi:hypothetical protein